MKYKTIVIDPPWQINKIKRKVRPNQIDMDYKTMSLKEIQELPINKISDENSVLLLWTIQKYLPDSYELLKRWGFKYLLTLTWNKNNGLCLFGFHWKTEFVIVGYKGKINMYPKRKTIPSVFEGKSKKHSAKPDEFYNMVRNSFPEPRIDIFNRRSITGFEGWGDESPNFTQSLSEIGFATQNSINKDLTATQQVASPKSASQTSLNPDIQRLHPNLNFCSQRLK